jgi:hypothetical protein
MAKGGGEGGGCGAASERRGKNRGGGENSASGGGSVLKEEAGRGPEGWAPRGGGAGEREGERELAWRGAARQCGIGVSAARPWRARAACCRVTVESGGSRRDVVDVADRWAGARWGLGHQRLGAA